MIASAITLAVVLSQAVPEPEDSINDHTKVNIRNGVRSGNAGAAVTVISADDKVARLRIDEVVQGTLPADTEVEVPAKSFVKCDLVKGTELLVFFRGKPGALVASGQYELIYEGQIRQYARSVYLARTRYEAALIAPKVKAEKVAAPTAAPATPPHASLQAVTPAGT